MKMKRIPALLMVMALMLALVLPAAADETPAVVRSAQKLVVFGGGPEGRTAECGAFNIDGYNYFRLRDLAVALADSSCRFNVAYDAEKNAVVITTGAAYTGPTEQPVWNLPFNAKLEDYVRRSSQTLLIDGKTVDGLTVYSIGEFNWFQLRELQKYLGYSVSFDEASNEARIHTPAPAGEVAAAADYAEIYRALSGVSGRYGGKNGPVIAAEDAEAPAPVPEPTPSGAAETPAAADKPAAEASGSEDYSGTNVQIEGFDEADIVKTDGSYIYVIREGRELVILRAAGEDTAVVSRTEIGFDNYDDDYEDKHEFYESKYAQDMYVADGRAVILSGYSRYEADYSEDGGWDSEDERYAAVDFYDVSDPAAPRLISALGQDGSVADSRLAGGRVYVVSDYYVWNWDEEEPATYIPRTYKNGAPTILPVDRIFLPPVCSSTEYVVVASYDAATGEMLQTISLLGSLGDMYMNDSGIYLLSSDWRSQTVSTYRESVYDVTEYLNASETRVTRIAIADGALSLAGSGTVPGSLENQFSADEYNGYLRIVTTRDDNRYRVYRDAEYGFENYQWDERQMTTGLYILDGSLSIVGRVEDLSPDERIYSARFDGDIAYFCTYRQTDPLFAVDVSDPANPTVLSALKISGFSRYLHAWGGDRLFGFGNETNEETGWSEGLKLVMFDTADKTDVSVENYLVLEGDYSEALYNHKAFLIDRGKDLIGFAGSDDYYLFTYDPDAGFAALVTVPCDYGCWEVRGLYIGDVLYIVSQGGVTVVDMNAWEILTSVSIGP